MAFQTLSIFKKRVVGASLSRFHQVSMATDAQFGVVLLGCKELFVGRAMGPVAAFTIALNDRLVGIGLQKRYFGVKMTGIANRVGPVFQHPVKIRPVGVMAGTAGSLGKRLVAGVGCLSRSGFLMTGEAQFFLRGQEQFAVIGGMPFMAGQTSAIIRYRFVRAFQRHVFIRMAAKTQGVARLGK